MSGATGRLDAGARRGAALWAGSSIDAAARAARWCSSRLLALIAVLVAPARCSASSRSAAYLRRRAAPAVGCRGRGWTAALGRTVAGRRAAAADGCRSGAASPWSGCNSWSWRSAADGVRHQLDRGGATGSSRRRWPRTPACTPSWSRRREAGVHDERQRMARRDPRHARPGAHRHRHPARGGRARARAAPATGAATSTPPSQLARDSLARGPPLGARRSRPRRSTDARLPDAIADVAERWSADHTASRPRSTTTGDRAAAAPGVEVTLLRTAQEALANVGQPRRRRRASGSPCPTWRTW